jgi:hypothetical protein
MPAAAARVVVPNDQTNPRPAETLERWRHRDAAAVASPGVRCGALHVVGRRRTLDNQPGRDI